MVGAAALNLLSSNGVLPSLRHRLLHLAKREFAPKRGKSIAASTTQALNVPLPITVILSKPMSSSRSLGASVLVGKARVKYILKRKLLLVFLLPLGLKNPSFGGTSLRKHYSLNRIHTAAFEGSQGVRKERRTQII